ncbi:alginate lyase family protein [Candidatus Clostridium stratigraminis]|uniref:Alginate lyase family protein n=1 Tax=Candidatus Clostridium stratigraminis TaxID=3381661 RepID=A0ABW8T0Z4_9CLOT
MNNNKNLKWFFHRLKAMSIEEIIFRFKKKLQLKGYEKNFKEKKTVLELSIPNLKTDKFNLLNNKIDEIWDFSNDAINEKKDFIVDIFDMKIDLSKDFSWHGFNALKWDKSVFSCNIDFKNKDEIGEIRLTWELNRHLFLPHFFLMWKNTNNRVYFEKAKELFYDWVNDNYFLRGVNWSSPMEIAIRAYQWILCYAIIKEADDNKLKEDLITAVINSIKYVSENFSGFSSANNHLILEAGLTSIIGELLKDVYNQNWFQKGYDVLEKEIKRQFYSEGVNKEHAAHYHGFVVDLLLQYNTFLKYLNKKAICEDILFKSVEFIGYLKYCKDFVEFGDSDDAKILNLTGKSYNYYDYLLAFGSKYFETSFTEDITNSQLSVWKYIKSQDIIKPFDYNGIKYYEKSGYFIYKSNELTFFFDIAELGFGSIAAHGHADCLAFVLSVKNIPIFVDPGTYIYNVESSLRNYFRSTSAHNTLTYDELSQSTMEGPFLWSKKANIIEKGFYEDVDYVVIYGSHDGYKPFTHKRIIYISKKYNLVIIKDEFDGDKGIVNFTLDSSNILSKINDKKYSINNNLYFYTNEEIEIHKQLISKSFLKKEETNAFCVSINKNSPCISIITDEEKLILHQKAIYKEGEIIFIY